MGDRVLLFPGELGHRATAAGLGREDRVVAEAAFAPRRVQDLAATLALRDDALSVAAITPGRLPRSVGKSKRTGWAPTS